MKYKLIKGSRAYRTTFGGVTYELDTETFREYPAALVSLYGKMLEPEATPKPQTSVKEDK